MRRLRRQRTSTTPAPTAETVACRQTPVLWAWIRCRRWVRRKAAARRARTRVSLPDALLGGSRDQSPLYTWSTGDGLTVGCRARPMLATTCPSEPPLSNCPPGGILPRSLSFRPRPRPTQTCASLKSTVVEVSMPPVAPERQLRVPTPALPGRSRRPQPGQSGASAPSGRTGGMWSFAGRAWRARPLQRPGWKDL